MTHSLRRRIVALCLAACAAGAHAADYGNNLIVNGDAESGVSAWSTFADVPLFATAIYADPLFLYPDAPHGSSHFLGSSSVLSAGWQLVDLTSNAGAVDTGGVSFKLDGYLGGVGDQEDNTLLYVSFLDVSGVEIGHTELGPNYVDLRDYLTVLGGFHTSGDLPQGTRALLFSLSMEGVDGSSSGAYADNLSFVLTSAVPDAQSWALMLLGLAAVTASSRRRRG